MAKYRKKPVVIDAERFWPGTKPWPEGVVETNESPTGYGIHTLEHTKIKHEVTPGDWIIKGVNGERYACKSDIFDETYERVSE